MLLHLDLPEGWEARRLKTLASVQASNVDKNKSESERPVKLCNYTDVYYSSEIQDSTGFMQGTATPEEIARFRLRKGDVLVTKDSESWDDIAVPAFVRRDFEDTVCGYHLYLVRPGSEIHGRYLAYVLESDLVAHQFKVSATGITRYGLSSNSFRNGIIPTPPLPDQKAIASFLDHETSRIDQLIDRKKRLIELLEEKRTALITRAVTKGLDPGVPMKDSGVEWLGNIPKHWQATKIKFVTNKIVDGAHKTPNYVEDGIPFITVKNLTKSRSISFEEVKYVTEEEHRTLIRRAKPERGDVLLTKDGTLGVPRVVETDRPFSIFVSVALLKPNRARITSHFLRFVLEAESAVEQFRSRTLGSALTHLHLNQIANVRLSIPPISEQERIVCYLTEELNTFRSAFDKLQRGITLLNEYRTALISAAVTGKIDVPDLAA